MTENFPLFRLPYVALSSVLDHVGPQRLFLLSVCSSKSKHLVKLYRGPSKSVELEVDIGICDIVSCKEKHKTWDTTLARVYSTSGVPEKHLEEMETVRIGKSKIPIQFGFHALPNSTPPSLMTFWIDIIQGFIELGNYAREIFQRDIDSMAFGKEVRENGHNSALDWVNRVQKSVGSIYLKPTYHYRNYSYFLENLRVTRQLSLYLKPPWSMNGNLGSGYIENVWIDPSYWVTRKMLLNMDCTNIALFKSELTSSDINKFLFNWINGKGCLRLKEIRVDLESGPIDIEAVLHGLEVERREPNEVTELTTYYGRRLRFQGGLHIQRKFDGAKAAVDYTWPSCRFWLILI